MAQIADHLSDFLTPAQLATYRELSQHDVSVVSCVYWRNDAPWRIERRTCHDTFLLFPVRGRVRVQLDGGRSILIAPGRFLILPEKTPHALELVKGHQHLHQIALHFHLHDRWQRSLSPRFPGVVGTLRHPKETFRDLSELTCLLSRDRATGRDFGVPLIHRLLAAHLRERGGLVGDQRPRGDARISLALERMESSLASPDFSVEDLARSIELTPVQFRKLFLRDIGSSPKSFLQQLRLRRARSLLRHTTSPVKEIAAGCGFASDHYFHRAFHRAHGQTPSEYRVGPHSEI